MGAGGYDGSIRISTEISSLGFNEGLKKLSGTMKAAFSQVLGILVTIATVALTVVAIIVMIAAAIAALVIGIVAFGVNLIKSMSEAISRTNAYGQEIAQIEVLFANVKGALYGAFSPLIAFALPYIKIVVAWLVNLLNTIAMIVAALTGQATVMQYIAGSADTAATNTGRLADQTNKAGKAAKGALASFDQLNVLQQQTADTSGGGVGAAGGAMQFVQVPVDTGIKEKVDAIKQWFADLWASISGAAIAVWAWISQAASDAWNFIVGIWNVVAPWFKSNVWDPVAAWFVTAWENIKQAAGAAWGWLQDNVLKPIGAKFGELVATLIDCGQRIYNGLIKPLIDWFMANLWPIIRQVINWVMDIFNRFVENLRVGIQVFVGLFKIGLDFVVSIFKNVFPMIKDIVIGIIDIIQGIVKFIAGVFTGDWKLAWEGVKDIFKGIFEGIGGIVKGVVNTVIDLINAMIRALVLGLNAVINVMNSIKVTIPKWVPVIGGESWGLNIPTVTAPQIPRLAKGAVIPPNAAFLSMLGDQRRGMNIEAPADLIRQIVREEVGNQGNQQITIRFEGTMSELVRVMKPHIDRENRLVGNSLIVGAR